MNASELKSIVQRLSLLTLLLSCASGFAVESDYLSEPSSKRKAIKRKRTWDYPPAKRRRLTTLHSSRGKVPYKDIADLTYQEIDYWYANPKQTKKETRNLENKIARIHFELWKGKQLQNPSSWLKKR